MTERAWGKRTGRGVGRAIAWCRGHEHWSAAALFALVVLVYLWPALVGGAVLSPASLLWGVPPWRASLPPEGVRYFNGLLSDVPTSYQPWSVLARDLIRDGTFPAWNPHAFAGTPLFGNLSVGWLDPFRLPLWILPLPYAFGVAAALKLWVAAFGTYLLVRELRLGFWPGVVAGIGFGLCAFNVVWLTHGAQVSVAAMLPWAVLLTERIVRRGAPAAGPALAIVTAVALAGGHPGTQVHVLAGTLLFALVRTATLAGVPLGVRGRRLAFVGGGMLVGVLLTAVVLLPGLEAATDTIGAEARRDGGASLIGSTLPLPSLLAAAFPDWWGRPSETLFAGPANYNERAFYAGVVALLLAAVALVSSGAWRRKAAFLPLLALGLAVPLDAPLVHDVVVGLPGFDRVQDQRMLLWFSFAVSILAAFGLRAVLDAPRRQARTWVVVAAAFAGGVVAFLAIDRAPGDAGRALDHLTDRFAGLTPGALASAGVVRWLALVALVAAVLALLRARSHRARLAAALVAMLVALDMLQFANAYQPMGPQRLVIPPRTPAIAYLQQRAADGRFVGLRGALMNDWSTVYGLRDARGYDAPQPSRRFFRLWRIAHPEQVPWRLFDVPALTPQGLRVLSLLGARWVVAEPGAPLPPSSGLSDAYRGADATIFANENAAPRARVARDVVVAGDAEHELAAVLAPAFDPRRDAVVRRVEVGASPPSGAAGSARVIAETNASVTLRATLARPGLVVLGDAWAPGWSVTVDGRPARPLQADVVMRGVAVAAGEHEIVWRYRVPGLATGALLSALGLAALLAWTGLLVRRARRVVR